MWRVFQKSPSVTLNSGRNELIVEQDTYEKGRPARIVISNMPANKLIHLAICVNQRSFDIYINGLLYSHTSLHALPMQNAASRLYWGEWRMEWTDWQPHVFQLRAFGREGPRSGEYSAYPESEQYALITRTSSARAGG